MHGVSETCMEVGGQRVIWLMVVFGARDSTLTCRMTTYVIYLKQCPNSTWCCSWQENTVHGFVPSERHSWVEDKNPINFTSMVTPAGGILYCTARGNWTRGDGDLVFFFYLILEVPTHPSQCKVERSCMKPLRSLAGPEWLIHWLIISCYNPVSMWPQRNGRQMRRWWWRWKIGMLRGRKSLELINTLPTIIKFPFKSYFFSSLNAAGTDNT